MAKIFYFSIKIYKDFFSDYKNKIFRSKTVFRLKSIVLVPNWTNIEP